MAMNPYTQTETQAGVADYAMPYVESMLGAAQNQLFNVDPSGNLTGLKGYTPYSYNAADYFAGFTPMQQQAQQGVANLGLPSSFGQAMGLTGQTYGNLMVDVNALGSEKLRDRARRIVHIVTDLEYDEADKLLKSAHWNVKAAIVMQKAGLTYAKALARLKKSDDLVREAIGEDIEPRLRALLAGNLPTKK